MSDIVTSNTSGDATTKASGDAASKNDNVIQQEPKKETVSYETYSRTLSKLKKLEEQFELTQKEKDAQTQKALEEQGQWKLVAEAERKKYGEISTELNQTKKMIDDSVKMNAFLKQIPGNVSDEYWSLINLDEIVLDPETRKPDPVAIESYAKAWMERHPRLIDKTSTAKVPTEAPKVTNLGQVNLTIADMAKKLAGLKL
jgi:hypothetical protein